MLGVFSLIGKSEPGNFHSTIPLQTCTIIAQSLKSSNCQLRAARFPGNTTNYITPNK